MWEAGKAVGGCKFARECFKVRCFPAPDNRGPIVCSKPHSLWRLSALTLERPDRYKQLVLKCLHFLCANVSSLLVTRSKTTKLVFIVRFED